MENSKAVIFFLSAFVLSFTSMVYAEGYDYGIHKAYKRGYHDALHGNRKNPEIAITVWMFAYNNWEACVDKIPMYNNGNCFRGDSLNTEVQLGVVHLTGGVSKPNGDITLVGSAYETEKRNKPYIYGVDPGQFGRAMMDAQNTEIHFIVRTHGKVIKPQPDEQLIQAVDKYCKQDGGDGGDRDCKDIYYGAFPVGVKTTPVYEFNPDIAQISENNPLKIFGCANIFRSDGSVQMVIHTNVKKRKTRWLKKTCGMN